VFLLSAHHMPLRPKLDGLGSERDFACGFGHSNNISPIPEDGHLGHGLLWSHFNFTVTGFGAE